MNEIIDAAKYGLLAFGAIGTVWGIARMIEPACFDEPKKPVEPENVDKLVRQQRTTPIEYAEGHCINCKKAIQSAAYPMRTCTLLNELVYPNWSCARWEK